MNLYQVMTKEYEWCAYCIAPTRSKAKLMVAQEFGEEYTDMRCKTIQKGVKVENATVIDSDLHPMYHIVTECGHKYYTDEERAEIIEGWLKEGL